MESLTTAEKIKRLESELATLREQECAEREAAFQKEREARKEDLRAIRALIDKFNEKYNDSICLGAKRNSKVGNEIFLELFPWL